MKRRTHTHRRTPIDLLSFQNQLRAAFCTTISSGTTVNSINERLAIRGIAIDTEVNKRTALHQRATQPHSLPKLCKHKCGIELAILFSFPPHTPRLMRAMCALILACEYLASVRIWLFSSCKSVFFFSYSSRFSRSVRFVFRWKCVCSAKEIFTNCNLLELKYQTEQ